MMLMRTDPFRDLDRWTQQVLGTVARPAVMPMDAWRAGDQFIVELDCRASTVIRSVWMRSAMCSPCAPNGPGSIRTEKWCNAERPRGIFSRQLFLGDTLDADQIQASYQDGVLRLAIPVGTLTVNAAGTAYVVGDARVVLAAGEGKNWTPDGKSVIVLGGYDDQGNVDDVQVDLATGTVTRLTGNLDYDEDIDESPNGQWIAVGSLRGQDALTPLSRIDRPSFLYPFDIGAVYTAYAIPTNISNQEWLVASADDLQGENGIPLFVNDDGWTARSMPSFNQDGTDVAFWEYGDVLNLLDPNRFAASIANT
jgi:WD40 repeat protein